MVRVAAIKHLVEMAEVAHHGDDVVLDVAEVEADFGPGRDAVLVIAAFGEALDDVRFASQKPHEGVDLLPAFTDLAEEGREVVGPGDEDLFFDGVGFALDGCDDGAEGVDDIVTAINRISYWAS